MRALLLLLVGCRGSEVEDACATAPLAGEEWPSGPARYCTTHVPTVEGNACAEPAETVLLDHYGDEGACEPWAELVCAYGPTEDGECCYVLEDVRAGCYD